MKKSFKKSMSKALSLLFILSLGFGSGTQKVSAAQNSTEAVKELLLKNVELKSKFSPNDRFSGVKYPEEAVKNENAPIKTEDPNEKVRIIVQLEDKPAGEQVKKSRIVTKAEVDAVKAKQDNVKAKVKAISGTSVRHSYGNLINGFSIETKRGDIEKISNIPGVLKVSEAKIYYPQMKSAKELTQAYNVWEELGYKGEGMVVSIIDTGIDYTHKDMTSPKDASQMKLKDKNPKGPGKYYTDKVPYGYNFADRNDEVIDRTDSMHGMHVAGIVAANGDPKEVEKFKAVQGVAPQAQLLAMKVFSNGPESAGAFSDDIVAAIEDSVAHSADVINMSLGATASFQDPDDPEQRAIRNAVEAGVVVVVSAGNSQYSSAPYKFASMSDTGLVGSPGLAIESLQVANFQNSNVTLPAFQYKAEGKTELIGYTLSEVNPVNVFKPTDEFELVDCGLGKPGDFKGKDLNKKIALIKRGDITFVEKKLNAQAAGAAGAVIYNGDGDNSYLNMATDPSVKIPGVFLSNKDGVALKSLIEKGLKLTFGDFIAYIENVNKNDFDASTSWGPTPNLDFKPEIAGPGGNIYSTVNNNQYESMSGTSMAAPHVSGGEALILQAIKKMNLGLQKRELVEFAKNTSINTAEIKMDKNHPAVPYSPRRQGSGLIQMKNAINNKVIAVGKDGRSVVSLKEIGKNASFEITLKNYGDKAVSYAVENFGGVLTEQTKAWGIGTMSYDVALNPEDGKVIFDNTEVTVPAKGQVKLTATINLSDKVTTERFIEGFIKFNAKGEAPSLVVPFMGYYGDWSKERIINYAAWEENNDNLLPVSLALTKYVDDYQYLGYDGEDEEKNLIIKPEYIAISPNDDEIGDEIVPYLYHLRNAKKTVTELLDKDGNLISELKQEEDIRRKVFNDGKGGNVSKIFESLSWDGKLYNSKTGKYEAVPEGDYFLNVKSWVNIPNAKPQDFKIPVKIDVTEPKVNIVSAKTSETKDYELKWTATDEGSGINPYDLIIFINGEYKDVKFNHNEDGSYSCHIDLKENSYNDITIGVLDRAGNIGMSSIKVKKGNFKPEITFDNFNKTLELSEKDAEDDVYTVTGKVTAPIKVLKINNVEAEIKDDLTFSVGVKLEQGLNYIPVYAESLENEILKNYSNKVYYDSIAPIIELESPSVNKDGNVITNKDSILLKGKVSDNTVGYKFYINGKNMFNVSLDGEMGADKNIRPFEETITVEDGDKIELKAVDLFGHETVKTISVIIDKEAPVITVEGVADGGLYNKSVTPIIKANKTNVVVTSMLNGKPYDGKEISKEGKYELTITAVDEAGNSTEAVYKFQIDKTAPTINIKGVEPGKIYSGSVSPIIEIDDKDATVKITLNGKAYEGTPISEIGKYELVVTAVDKAGNQSKKAVAFEIKKDKPADNSGDKSGNNNSGKLVKTGSLVNTNLLISFGIIIIGVGFSITSVSKKRRA